MVKEEQVVELMVRYFPKCSFCGSDSGYEVSGINKNYVQCKSCLAKWMSNDFIGGKELKKMQLWEPSKDGKGVSLLKKDYSVSFWQTLDLEQLEQSKVGKLTEEAPFILEEGEKVLLCRSKAIYYGEEVHMTGRMIGGGVGGGGLIAPSGIGLGLGGGIGGARFKETKRERKEEAQASGLLYLTNYRLVFYESTGLLSKKRKLYAQIPLEAVASINFESKALGITKCIGIAYKMDGELGRASIALMGSKKEEVEGWVVNVRNAMEELTKKMREKAAQYAPKEEKKETAIPTVDPLEQIKKLSELRDAGLITEEEFQAKKKELLAKI